SVPALALAVSEHESVLLAESRPMSSSEPIATNATDAPEKRKGPSTKPNFAGLLKALRRRWLLACFLGLSLGGLAAVVAWFGLPPPKHVASAVLHVSSVEERVIEEGAAAGTPFAIYQQNQKALLTSRFVIIAALRNLSELSVIREQNDPAAWLQRELKVDFTSGPEYMRLSLSGNRPEELKKIVKEVTDAYLKEVVKREHTKLDAHLDQLKKILAAYEETLGRRRKSVRALTVAVGSGDPQAVAMKQRYAIEALGEAEKELLRVKSELRQAQLEVKKQTDKQKGLPSATVPSALVEQLIQKDPNILEAQGRKRELEKAIDRLSPHAVGGKKAPSLQPLFRQVEE